MDYATYIDKKDRGLASVTTTGGVSVITFLKFDPNTGEKVLDESVQVDSASLTNTIAKVQSDTATLIANLQAIKNDL